MRCNETELWRYSALEDEDLIFDPGLLCEDGWLTAEELAAEDDVRVLLRKAVKRGFPMEADSDVLSEESVQWLKENNIHRVWNVLADEDIYLRAPPHALAV